MSHDQLAYIWFPCRQELSGVRLCANIPLPRSLSMRGLKRQPSDASEHSAGSQSCKRVRILKAAQQRRSMQGPPQALKDQDSQNKQESVTLLADAQSEEEFDEDDDNDDDNAEADMGSSIPSDSENEDEFKPKRDKRPKPRAPQNEAPKVLNTVTLRCEICGKVVRRSGGKVD